MPAAPLMMAGKACAISTEMIPTTKDKIPSRSTTDSSMQQGRRSLATTLELDEGKKSFSRRPMMRLIR